MKSFILLFAPLLLCMKSYAQSRLPLTIESPQMDTYLNKRQPPSLTIQVDHAPDSIKSINIKYTFVSFGPELQVTKYDTTDQDGYLKITLTQNFPYQQIWLNVGNYLYTAVYVNSDLKITVDANKIKNKNEVYLYGDGVCFSGSDGKLNEVMNKHLLYKQRERNKLMADLNKLGRSQRQDSLHQFLKTTDVIWQSLTDIDLEFAQKYPSYGWAVRNETASAFYGLLCTAYWGDVMPAKLFAKINNHQPYFTSNKGVLFYKYLNTYIYLQKEKVHSIENTIQKIDNTYPFPKADILKTALLTNVKDSFALAYPKILSSMKTQWCKVLVADALYAATGRQKKTDSLLASAQKLNTTGRFIGKPLMRFDFNADLYVLNSVKNLDTLILNLKSKFRNKALIVDFWATWCSPCLSDMPVSKQLHEANKDLPIEYIYICTSNGSNIHLWENKIAGLQLPGTHIFMDEKIVNDLKSSFGRAGAGFPAYVVIGMDGKLRLGAIQRMGSMDRDTLKKATGIK